MWVPDEEGMSVTLRQELAIPISHRKGHILDKHMFGTSSFKTTLHRSVSACDGENALLNDSKYNKNNNIQFLYSA